MAAKLPFGGMTVCFAGCEDSLEDVFGSGKMPPSQMTKKIWSYVKSKKLMKK